MRTYATDLTEARQKSFSALCLGIFFETYIRNNEEFIPNFGERYRNGETISTAFVESTVDQVMSKRMVKKQHAMDTPRGAFTPADSNKGA